MPAFPLPRSLVELVDRLAERPEAGLTVYDRRGRNEVRRPYPEVAARARARAAWLAASGVRPGELVYLCLNTSHELIETFLGAALLGAVPCCLALPKAIGGLEVFRRRLGLLERFGANHLVTTADVAAEAGRAALVVPDDPDLAAVPPAPPSPAPGELAYVQLTSGSTQTPKAVAISHANLAANAHGIVARGAGHADETYVSWLPLYHDMGLVGMTFTALYHGVGLALMPPEAFLGTPRRWLEAIAAQPTTVVTTAPNFGYQWCVDRVPADKVAGLDLSRWRLACCGAEMVRPATLDDFAARFAPAGFDRAAFLPCYGLAEATLAATMCPARRPTVVRDGLVSCGPPLEGLEVSVRAPEDGRPLDDGAEGEVCLRGTSVFLGYFLDEEATAAARRDGWFRTGDLGYLRDGELYVTGRVKDLLVLDGANVAPHELEWLAQDLIDLDGGRAAAFSVEHARREVPVLVVEVREAPAPEATDALRGRAAHDVAPLFDLVFVRRGTLPKTSSGKVQRSAVRARYLEGALEGVLWRLRPTPDGGTT